MFVRFRQTKTRLQTSVIRSHRIDGRVRNQHIATLGTVAASPTIAERLVFWQRLHERMAKLGNRIDAATQARLLNEIHARVPMVTPDEMRALQLGNAKADAQVWDAVGRLHQGAAEDQEGVIASAERAQATARAEQARATAEAERARDRIARIESGGNVDGGLGKPMNIEEFLEAGFTKAELVRFRQLNEVMDVYGFAATKQAILEAKHRAERSTVRALHRRISGDSSEDS